ncbi:MAG: cytochrome b/b6 domain-containing protein [Ideonella sp.]|nr:cytochrome b/b6 domain-containing protein [Ideonella sp.]
MSPNASTQILVWDWPTRVFHWLMVLCFAGAWLTSESERLQRVHITLGYSMAGLVAFRVVWGLMGTRHARFTSFVHKPVAAVNYVKGLFTRKPEHHVGHNPAGAYAVLGLLALGAGVAFTGWLNDSGEAPHWLEEAHELLATGMLVLVALHVLGVVVGSVAHRENLVRAMFTGRKRGRPEQAIRSTWAIVAALMLCAVLGWWAWQWQHAPSASGSPGAIPSAAASSKVVVWLSALKQHDADDDEDDD